MSAPELDLFGEPIAAAKPKFVMPKPVPKYQPPRDGVIHTIDRPCTIQRISRTEVLVINSDSAHLFR